MSDTVTYVLNAEELFTALWHTRRSTKRLVAQTVLLLLIGLPCLVGLCIGYRDSAAWLCGIVLPLLAVLQWVLPWIEFRHEANTIFQKHTPVTIIFTNDTLSVQDETVAWQNATLRRVKDMVLWNVCSQWIAIPRRAVSEDVWKRLTAEDETMKGE